MARVLLIRPLCEGEEPEFAEPLGIERLAGYLLDHGVCDVHVFDRRLSHKERRAGIGGPGFWQEVQATCGDAPPDVVGVSLMTAADVRDALRIMSRLWAWWPNATFVAGGLYVTTAADEARKRFPAHTVLQRGEGEAALLSLAQQKEWHSSPSLDRPDSQPLASPDDWSMAYRPALERYAALGCAVNMQTSRGCPGTCTFCATPSLPAGLRRWRPRDLRLVADEVEREASRLTAAGLPPVFNFVDDDFGPLSRVEELAAKFGRRNLRVAFSLEMRLASLTGQGNLARRLAVLHEAGLTRVFFGVESLNHFTLAGWRKTYDVSALPQVLRSCAAAGVTVQAGYIMWHARQTVGGARDEARALWDLGIYTHRAALSRLIVFPGCELAQKGWHDQLAASGFQRMSDDAEYFYKRFADETRELTQAWTEAAIAEPHAAAVAHLTGDRTRVDALHATLDEINTRSYELLCSL